MAGRKPKPTAIKLAEGNPGHRPINRNEPQPGGEPVCPKHVKGEARKLWKRLAPELVKLGVATLIDSNALARYCVAHATYLEALAEVETGGKVITTDKGNLIQSPWVGIANVQAGIMAKIESEFGLTPSSRSKIQVKPARSEKDDLADFVAGGDASQEQYPRAAV